MPECPSHLETEPTDSLIRELLSRHSEVVLIRSLSFMEDAPDQGPNYNPLKVHVMVPHPFPTEDDDTDWEKALDLIEAAHSAVLERRAKEHT